jgi:hypothetical protein
MNKTLDIEVAEHGEAIAKAIEEAHINLECSAVAVAVCSCSMAAKIARGTR